MIAEAWDTTDPLLSPDLPLFLRAQVRQVHGELDGYLAAWEDRLAHGSLARGSTVPSLYLHGATVEDATIHMLLLHQPPLFSTAWTGSLLARDAPDLRAIREYAGTVYAATDTYLATLTQADACRRVDLSRMNLGYPTVAWVVSRFVVLELAHLGGELARS